MMDPFSIVVGVVGISAVALHSVRRLKEFISSIQNAPSIITAIGVDLNALYSVLEFLHGSLQTSFIDEQVSSRELIPIIQPPLDICLSTIRDIELKILPFAKKSKRPGKMRWRSSISWIFREKGGR